MATGTFSLDNIFNVKDLIVVITGGGTGLGLMMATALENNGAIVYIAGRRLNILENAIAKHSKHGNLHALQVDVTDKKSILALVETIKEKHGYLNVLINNSGVLGTSVKVTPDSDIKDIQEELFNQNPEDWLHTYNTNVVGVFFTTIGFLGLLDQGNKISKVPYKSQVITTSSIAGFMRHAAFTMSYNASKAAATHLAKIFATYLAPKEIRSNVIAPGIYPSEMTAGPSDEQNKNELAPLPRSSNPLGRGGFDEEMAGTCLYLVGKSGGFCDGTVVVTDGGRLSVYPSNY